MAAKKILVVDDSSIARAAVRHTLEAEGYAVIETDSAFALSSLLHKERPDLVLMDVQLPSLHGDKAVHFARHNQLHDCPFLLYSERPESELETLARSSGAAGYLCKSWDRATLLQRIDQTINPGAL